jgi:hypothetical protein
MTIIGGNEMLEKGVQSRLEKPSCIETSRAANGGFIAKHKYDNGDSYPVPHETHAFGSNEKAKFIKHIKAQLGFEGLHQTSTNLNTIPTKGKGMK